MFESLAQRALELVLGLSGPIVYLLVGVLSWAEAAFFLGFVTPGELAIATAGVLASRGQVTLVGVAVAAAVGTVLGNTTGYWLGRAWGTRLLEWGPLCRLMGGVIGRTRDFMDRRGEWAIVVGRLATFSRIIVPFLAGASRLSYRRFLLFDLPTGIAWATAWAVAGFALGESWRALFEVAGSAAFLVLGLFAAALLIRWAAVRIAANRRRVEAFVRLTLMLTGVRGLARALVPMNAWIGRRLDPRFAGGLSLTLGFTVLFAGVGAVGLVLGQTQAVQGLALIDFPVLEWMSATRTDEAVQFARGGLELFHLPGVLLVALPIAAVLGRRRGVGAAVRFALGLVGAGAGAFLLDRHVLEGVVPMAEFPSVPVTVASALLVHVAAESGRAWGWGAAVAAGAVGTFAVCVVALATVVAGWAAPSGIALGLALGLVWGSTLEVQDRIRSPARSSGEGGGLAEADPGGRPSIRPA